MKTPITRLALYALLFLIFFQLLADFIEAIYAFGLLGTSIPPELAAVALLFSPVILLLAGDRLPPRVLLALGGVMLLARVVEPLVDTRWRMLSAGIGVAAFLLLLPALLARARQEDDTLEGALAGGLLLATAASTTLRTFGSGNDLSTVGMFQGIGWALAALAAWLLPGELRRLSQPRPHQAKLQPAGWAKTIGLSLGLVAVFILLYFVFTAPHVLARWTGVDYRLILPVYALALLLGALLLTRPAFLAQITWPRLLAANLLFVLALALTARVHQVPLPAAPEAYPVTAPAVTWVGQTPLWFTLLLFPVLFADFGVLAGALRRTQPGGRMLGAGFTLAALLLLLLVFANVFTTVYDYIPVVGPLFRDAFWAVQLAPGLLLLLVMLLRTRGERAGAALSRSLLAPAGVLLAAAVAGVFLVSARPAPAADGGDGLHILTYNIQQGYSEDGRKSVTSQLALMRELAPDIIGLQETDDARIANGNVDVVRFLADRLDMHAYYGPSTVTGTFGIALLSRYPILQPRTHFLYSAGEQVAVIEAQVVVGGQTYTIFVNHLGNGGPLIQQQQFLTLAANKSHVIALGDWNFRPDTEQYANMIAVLDDTWTRQWPDWGDDQGQKPDRKIDHIFVSPDLPVTGASFIASPASDHPAVTATLGK